MTVAMMIRNISAVLIRMTILPLLGGKNVFQWVGSCRMHGGGALAPIPGDPRREASK